MFPFSDKAVVKGPVDLVAAVPYLLGFHPRECLVCLGVDGEGVTVATHLRLPATPDSGPDWMVAARVVAASGHQVFLLGYGPAEQVDSHIEAGAVVMATAGIEVVAALRVHDGRIYCLGSGCGCSPDGIAFDPDASAVPATATLHGVAPLADREAIDNLLEPPSGADRDHMREATITALRRMLRALSQSAAPGAEMTLGAMLGAGPPPHVVASGVTTVREALAAADRGEVLTDDAVAWLATVLLIPDVRAYAVRASDGSDQQRALWIDVTRRAVGVTAAAPACLVAVTAYLHGDGALAVTAIRRSLAIDPGSQTAQLVADALEAGIPPAAFRAAITGRD
ncbi:hypothetical protein Ais01nite_73840 [Asanoa ishikariensis]|uniref:DUF4192 domain-containing protein n=2 Tax=Asanoa ishikariensis TaxID=137265 RepID=A0A1H3URP3_9ACTN|nr:DUF4192 domain-containing protein [Asanoa ishikariensis]GIF69349.1 hypothetical protein Ais01nite_73840 [Asanoa ishikariensis]SDZ65027.1 protein of unknown function [Asanoa ishikariensis]